MEINREIFDKVRTIAVFGNTGSGKTAFCYHILEILKDKPIYFFKHPKPELIESLGYFNLTSLEEMEGIQDSVLYIDEPQINLDIYNKRSNAVIAKICSLSRQLNITLIISSSDTRVFGKSNEAYFDMWVVKDLDYDMIKNGGKIKNIIKSNARFDPKGLRLKEHEFILDVRKYPKLNGKHTFRLLPYFNERHSKPFYDVDKANNCDKKSDKMCDKKKIRTENFPSNISLTLQTHSQDGLEITNTKQIDSSESFTSKTHPGNPIKPIKPKSYDRDN